MISLGLIKQEAEDSPQLPQPTLLALILSHGTIAGLVSAFCISCWLSSFPWLQRVPLWVPDAVVARLKLPFPFAFVSQDCVLLAALHFCTHEQGLALRANDKSTSWMEKNSKFSVFSGAFSVNRVASW